MSSSLDSHLETNSFSSARVAELKKSVQSFFANDWCQLRTLIMELEVDAWNQESTMESFHLQEQHARKNMQIPEASDSCVVKETSGTKDSTASTLATDRLSALAEQIERRLQAAVAVER